MQRWRGFTLIELMIVVAIVAILAAIAYPAYTRYMGRSHRSAAQAYLMDLAQRQQQYLLDNRDYANTGTLITGSGALDPPSAQVGADYTVTVSTLDDSAKPLPNFVLTATPKTGSLPAQYANDTLTLDNTGNKTPSSVW